jgi:alanine dehydrogenase
MLLLARPVLDQLIDFGAAVEAVEASFAAHARGEARMPPKTYLALPEYGGDFRAMPAYVTGAAGLKWVNSHPRNPAGHGLPTVMGVMLLNDPSTGQPLSILDGGLITRLRTGAAAAVATRHLARLDTRTLGFIGCGGQAQSLIRAVSRVRPPSKIVLFDRDAARADALARALTPLPADVGSAEEAAGCDVVTTATPGLGPVLDDAWVRPGTHVNAMGADGPGKQEIDPALLRRARVIVDDREQSVHGGEINVPIQQGRFTPSDIAATLGEVVAGLAHGRATSDEVTLFDSTGLAIQDIAVAQLAYRLAVARGAGTRFEFD